MHSRTAITLGSKALELVMDAGCVDNRSTASLCTWPPGCSPLVPPPSQEVGSAWTSLSLAGCKYTSKGVFRETHSLSRPSKIYRHEAFQITHSQWLHSTTQHHTHWWGVAVELASALTVATILANAQSPHHLQNDLCVELHIKPYTTQPKPYTLGASMISICPVQIIKYGIVGPLIKKLRLIGTPEKWAWKVS